jgi:hypothetical protein
MPTIPARVPVGDAIEGVLLRAGDRLVLARSAPSDVVPAVAGLLMVRYGVRYLGKPFMAIVPALVALDYGDFLTGDAAWEFVTKRSNLYPRSDVIGHRHDGVDEMLPLKHLDLALPPMVLVYADEAAVVPLGEVWALLGAPSDFPARAANVLPCYPSWSAVMERAADVDG